MPKTSKPKRVWKVELFIDFLRRGILDLLNKKNKAPLAFADSIRGLSNSPSRFVQRSDPPFSFPPKGDAGAGTVPPHKRGIQNAPLNPDDHTQSSAGNGADASCPGASSGRHARRILTDHHYQSGGSRRGDEAPWESSP